VIDSGVILTLVLEVFELIVIYNILEGNVLPVFLVHESTGAGGRGFYVYFCRGATERNNVLVNKLTTAILSTEFLTSRPGDGGRQSKWVFLSVRRTDI